MLLHEKFLQCDWLRAVVFQRFAGSTINNNNNNIYYLVLRKLTYIKWSNAHYKLLKLTKNILIIELNMNISVNDTLLNYLVLKLLLTIIITKRNVKCFIKIDKKECKINIHLCLIRNCMQA